MQASAEWRRAKQDFGKFTQLENFWRTFFFLKIHLRCRGCPTAVRTVAISIWCPFFSAYLVNLPNRNLKTKHSKNVEAFQQLTRGWGNNLLFFSTTCCPPLDLTADNWFSFFCVRPNSSSNALVETKLPKYIRIQLDSWKKVGVVLQCNT